MNEGYADALIGLEAIAWPATITRKSDGRFLAVNSFFTATFGHSEEDLLGRTAEDIGLYHIKEKRSNVLEEINGNGYASACELQLITKAAKILTCLFSRKPVRYGGEECFLSTIVDITQRREIDRKYQTIFESALDAMLLIDQGIIVDCNQRAVEVSSCSRDEIIGKPPHYFASQVQPDGTLATLSGEKKIEAALKGFPQRFDWQNTFQNGTQHFSEVTLSRVWLEDRWMLLAVMRDITQSKTAEAELVKSKKGLVQIIEFLPDPMFAVDHNRRVIVWNRAMEIMSGVKAGDILMEGAYSYGKAFYGYCRPMLIDFLFDLPEDIYPRFYRDNDAFFAESDLVTMKSGKKFYLWGKASLLYDIDGRVVGAIEVIRDITEQKVSRAAVEASESRLRLALEAVKEGVWDKDIENGTCYYSPRCYTMLGYDPQEFDASYDIWKSLVHPDDRFLIEETIESNMNGIDPKEYFQGEYRMRGKDGEWRWILSRGRVISRDAQGKGLRIVGTHSDITDRRRLEREMLRAEKLEATSILAGGIAHDFNNLITVIINNISSAGMHLTKQSRISDKLHLAEKAAERARDLAMQLMTFSKNDVPSRKTTTISNVIRESAEFILQGSHVPCSIEIPADVWPVDIDEGQMSQVLNNLLINANQAMPDGGSIEIRVYNLEATEDGRHVGHCSSLLLPPGKYVVIVVKDHGVGIAQEHLNRIFDPYFTTKQQGSGLGLASVQSIIKKHSGFIAVDSVQGVGTHFSIYLQASSKAVSEQNDASAHSEGCHVKSAKILVLDDEVSIRKLMVEILTEMGHTVVETTGVEQAFGEYLKAYESGKRFDLVITDLTFPCGLGGKDLMKKLLSIDPLVKTIVASGQTADIVMANYRDFGFCCNLSKPYRAEQLIEAVNRVLPSS